MASQVQNHSADRKSFSVVDRYFDVSLLLMLATSFTTLALTGQLDTPSKLVFSAALVLKLWKRACGSNFNLQPSTATGLGILSMLFYAVDLLIFRMSPRLTVSEKPVMCSAWLARAVRYPLR